MQLERCAQPSLWASAHRVAAEVCAHVMCSWQASNLVGIVSDDHPNLQPPRTTDFEGEIGAGMEVDAAEAPGIGEPWWGVADSDQ